MRRKVEALIGCWMRAQPVENTEADGPRLSASSAPPCGIDGGSHKMRVPGQSSRTAVVVCLTVCRYEGPVGGCGQDPEMPYQLPVPNTRTCGHVRFVLLPNTH